MRAATRQKGLKGNRIDRPKVDNHHLTRLSFEKTLFCHNGDHLLPLLFSKPPQATAPITGVRYIIRLPNRSALYVIFFSERGGGDSLLHLFSRLR